MERYAGLGARLINPIYFLLFLIWGASGLFFFRMLHIPVIDNTYFYMAIPDWDIPLRRLTGLPLLTHRSWLFHSTLLPMGLLGLWIGIGRKTELGEGIQRLINFLRDSALGLSVGIGAHLIWDAVLSSTRRGFYIHGLSRPASYFWLFANLLIGFGVPFLIARMLSGNRSIP